MRMYSSLFDLSVYLSASLSTFYYGDNCRRSSQSIFINQPSRVCFLLSFLSLFYYFYLIVPSSIYSSIPAYMYRIISFFSFLWLLSSSSASPQSCTAPISSSLLLVQIPAVCLSLDLSLAFFSPLPLQPSFSFSPPLDLSFSFSLSIQSLFLRFSLSFHMSLYIHLSPPVSLSVSVSTVGMGELFEPSASVLSW